MFILVLYLNIFLLSLLGAQGASLPSSDTGAGFEISGIVVDAATGDPLARTQVSVSPVGSDTVTTVLTGEDGRFAFAHLAEGKYTMRAQRHGYLSQFFDQHDLSYTSILVGSDGTFKDLVFLLSPECSISGAITDEAGEPVPDAQVTLFRTGVTNGLRRTTLLKTTTVDDEGFYEFTHLPAGRYLEAVSARPWYAQHVSSNSPRAAVTDSGDSAISIESSPRNSSQLDVVYPVTFYRGATEPDGAQPIDLKSGDHFVGNVELQPVTASRLHLNSVAVGSRITSVQLESIAFDGAELPILAETVPNSSGAMDVLGVPPGRYAVQISTAGSKNESTLSSREIEVSNNGSIGSIRESPSVTAVVTLLPGSGTSLPHEASLLFRNSTTGANFRTELIKNKLEYKQILSTGRYEVSLDYETGMYIKSISAGGATVIGRTLEIRGTSLVQMRIVIGQASGKISGVALRAAKPFRGATVVLVPSDPAHNGASFRTDQSNSDGSFALSNVEPGEYILLAIDKGWDLEWRDPAALKPYLAQGRVLRVQPNGTYQTNVSVQ